MMISMYQASVPVFRQYLVGLGGVLARAEAQLPARAADESTLIAARLAPDMFPLSRQVQIATDFARGAPARLAGLEMPVWPDVEANLAELRGRVDRAIASLELLRPEQIDGQEARRITLKVGGQPTEFEGLPYLLHFALPNFFFHTTTAYAILRHHGVDIGKRDFMGRR
jgi:hypothetical protein